MKTSNLIAIYKRLNRTKHQLTWTKFTLFLLSKITRRLFDPHLVPSFSQFGEDRVIDCYFGSRESGFYVDVGCNDPILYSNTWRLYIKGWQGIAIDANPQLIEKYKKVRPRDVAINKVISDKEETLHFYFSKTSHLISGIGSKLEGHWKRTVQNSDVVQLKSVRLCDVLRQHNVPRRFDLLTIDVEGNELNVLESLQFDIFRPSLIVVEMHKFDVSMPSADLVFEKLSKYNYRLIGFFPPTGFFAASDNDSTEVLSNELSRAKSAGRSPHSLRSI